MEFMSAYKHLDNLCRDINGTGLTGYIEDMERNHSDAYHVVGWENDYKQLKHYRWVRNQIAHENYADESNMCEPMDVEWLEDFYNRIMNQTDPLALARKATIQPTLREPSGPSKSCTSVCKKPKSSHRQPVGCAAAVYIVLAVLALFILFLFI